MIWRKKIKYTLLSIIFFTKWNLQKQMVFFFFKIVVLERAFIEPLGIIDSVA